MKPPRGQPDKLSKRYVDTESGWRPFFICILIAAILGLGFRLYFSPPRMKAWVTRAVNDQRKKTGSQFAFGFDAAELRLSDGFIPQFAVVLKGVRVAPAPACQPEPSLQIQELRLPLRLSRLIRGQFSVGIITAEGLVIDLDGIKTRCREDGTTASRANENLLPNANEPPESTPTPNSKPKPWWNENRIREIEAVVEGLDFSTVELQFENKKKHVFLDSLSAEVRSQNTIDLAAELRIPSDVTYGERLPSLVIEGSASADRADVKITARVDEGAVEANAILSPGPNHSLLIDAALGVEDVPLSTVVPLMRKVGLAGERFNPKFLWVNCNAKIEGVFQKLFETSPLLLNECSVEGDGTKLTLTKATRSPGGAWEPFTINVETLDLEKFLKTIGAEGPEGISNQFGRVRGKVGVNSKTDANFKGVLRGAKLSFSSQRVRAEQEVDSADLGVNFDGAKFIGLIDNVELRDGEAKGNIKLEFERGLKNGDVEARIETFELAPNVQTLLVKGSLGAISGVSHAKITDGKLQQLEASLKVEKTEGRDIRFNEARLKIHRVPEKPTSLLFDAPTFKMHRNSSYFAALKPIFLTHEFTDEWIPFENFQVTAHFPKTGGFDWKEARATFERDQISVRSVGAMDREHLLTGSVEVDYPLVKDLKWKLSGTSALPLLTEASPGLTKLRERAEIDDKALGLVERR